jgi:hypothetical protein
VRHGGSRPAKKATLPWCDACCLQLLADEKTADAKKSNSQVWSSAYHVVKQNAASDMKDYRKLLDLGKQLAGIVEKNDVLRKKTKEGPLSLTFQGLYTEE